MSGRGPGFGWRYQPGGGFCMVLDCREPRLEGIAYCLDHEIDTSEMTLDFEGVIVMQNKDNFKEVSKEVPLKKSSKKSSTKSSKSSKKNSGK